MMSLLENLINAFLKEAAALTKGSQRVMANKNLVSELAMAIRDDVMSNPSVFPPGSKQKFQKASDQDLAQWFLENIDLIEKEGYEGTVYSRDGVNSDWIVRRYIAGSHSWEDLTGVMNMNLRDWYLLKNRGLLDPAHGDIPKFNSVRNIGYYINTHYENQLQKVRDAAKNAARNKMAKSIKLVDNDDYRIYSTLNRAASCALGLGTQWCTANSDYGGHYHNYGNKAMLFQLFPYVKDEDGKPKLDDDGDKILNQTEKYQFDAGGPNFMNITDIPVPAATVRSKFPYLYDDLTDALKKNKSKLDKIIKDAAEDPTLKGDDYAVKQYKADEEIAKLSKFLDRGYFTDEERPKDKSSKDDSNAETPIVGEPAAQTSAEQPALQAPVQVQQMEGKTFKDYMLESKEEDEISEEDEEISNQEGMQGMDLGSMGGSGASGGGGKYPPGTAPTMPESVNHQGEMTMENVDKDVAAMMASLKKYDTLVESCAPVLMARPKPYVAEEKNKNPWEDLGKDDKDEDKKVGTKEKTHKGGTIEKTATGLKHTAADKKEDVKESADAEVLEWMQRFSKLGNMKGYGR